LAERQGKMAKKKLEGGLTTKTDILEFELHQRILQSDLELLRIQRKEISSELALLIGLDPTEEIRVRSDEHFEVSSPLPSADQLNKLALENNFELKQAELDIARARYERNQKLGEYLPLLEVEAQYGKLLETDFGSARSNSWSVIGMLKIPLFTGLSTWNRYQTSRSQLHQREVRAQQLALKVKARLALLVEKFDAYGKRYELAKANQKTAERYLESTLSEYQRGVKNSPDLATATDRSFDSRLMVFELEGELHLTRLAIAELVGKEEI
jgi:outer membrane protein TolC